MQSPVLYHYDLKFSHASRPEKKAVFKNRQNSKQNLSAISVSQNFTIRELKVQQSIMKKRAPAWGKFGSSCLDWLVHFFVIA
jgi:hypothetical protein